MKELGTAGWLCLLKIGKSAVPAVGVAAATTAVQKIAENSLVSFIMVLVTRQGAWLPKSV